MPIGIHLRDEEDFTLHEVRTDPGDVVYLFSDGYPDQFGGESNKKYSSRRFHELLYSVSGKEMESQKKILEQTLEDWQRDYPQVDDITLLGVRL